MRKVGEDSFFLTEMFHDLKQMIHECVVVSEIYS